MSGPSLRRGRPHRHGRRVLLAHAHGLSGHHSLTAVGLTPHRSSRDVHAAVHLPAAQPASATTTALDNCSFCPQAPATAWPYMSGLAPALPRLVATTVRYAESLYSGQDGAEARPRSTTPDRRSWSQHSTEPWVRERALRQGRHHLRPRGPPVKQPHARLRRHPLPRRRGAGSPRFLPRVDEALDARLRLLRDRRRRRRRARTAPREVLQAVSRTASTARSAWCSWRTTTGVEAAMVAGLDRAVGTSCSSSKTRSTDFPLDILERMYDTAAGGFDVVAAVPQHLTAADPGCSTRCATGSRRSSRRWLRAPPRVLSPRGRRHAAAARARCAYRQVLYRLTGYRLHPAPLHRLPGRVPPPRRPPPLRAGRHLLRDRRRGPGRAHVRGVLRGRRGGGGRSASVLWAVLGDTEPPWGLGFVVPGPRSASAGCPSWSSPSSASTWPRTLAEVRSRPVYTMDNTLTWSRTPTETAARPGAAVPVDERVARPGATASRSCSGSARRAVQDRPGAPTRRAAAGSTTSGAGMTLGVYGCADVDRPSTCSSWCPTKRVVSIGPPAPRRRPRRPGRRVRRRRGPRRPRPVRAGGRRAVPEALAQQSFAETAASLAVEPDEHRADLRAPPHLATLRGIAVLGSESWRGSYDTSYFPRRSP